MSGEKYKTISTIWNISSSLPFEHHFPLNSPSLPPSPGPQEQDRSSFSLQMKPAKAVGGACSAARGNISKCDADDLGIKSSWHHVNFPTKLAFHLCLLISCLYLRCPFECQQELQFTFPCSNVILCFLWLLFHFVLSVLMVKSCTCLFQIQYPVS